MTRYVPASIRQRLRGLLAHEGPPIDVPGRMFFGDREMRQAGVLIPIFERAGQMHVLLTRRSVELRNHSGEISFPGGRRDPEDADLLATALREAHEEISLAPGDVDVFGLFASVPTMTGFQISAYVGEFEDPYELCACPDEIDYLVELSFEELLEGQLHRMKLEEFKGIEFPMHRFELDVQPIFGATAYMLYELLVRSTT